MLLSTFSSASFASLDHALRQKSRRPDDALHLPSNPCSYVLYRDYYQDWYIRSDASNTTDYPRCQIYGAVDKCARHAFGDGVYPIIVAARHTLWTEAVNLDAPDLSTLSRPILLLGIVRDFTGRSYRTRPRELPFSFMCGRRC